MRIELKFSFTGWHHDMGELFSWPTLCVGNHLVTTTHDDVIKWKHFRRNWPFVRGSHRPPVNSPHKGHWRWALILALICVWINGWANNREAGDLRRYRAHSDVTVMVNFPCKVPYWALMISLLLAWTRCRTDSKFICNLRRLYIQVTSL